MRRFGSLRGSILMGDHTRSNVNVANGTGPVERLGDVVNAIWEIGVGYERSWTLANGSLAYIRLGGEWQQWENFSSNFDGTNGTQQVEDVWTGESDVGFGGVTFAFGYMR